MSGPASELLHINVTRKDALLLFMLIAKWQNGLSEPEFKDCRFRLKLEFEKFENWVRGIHGVTLK